MTDRSPRIVVVGAGAIGRVTAGLLARAGYDLHIVCKHPELAERIADRGLHVYGVRGEFYAPLPARAEIQELEGKYDLALIATKAPDMSDAARRILPLLKDDSAVVSMQNGICEDELAGIVGKERTIGCVVGWGATMHAPAELEMTSTGEFVIGTLDNRPNTKIPLLREMLSPMVPVVVSRNIYGHLFSKLIINSCITSLGAICGLTLGPILAIKRIRSLFIEIIREAVKVADAMQLRIEPYANRLDYYSFVRGEGFLADVRRHTFIRLMGVKYRRLKSSSLQSLERGRRTEVDYFNGYIRPTSSG